MEIPGIDSAAIHELTDELLHWLRRYEEKLNEAEELLYRTAAAIRQADQTLADNMKEFGLELLGWYDLQRVFGEYDPVTGERLSFGDRLVAGGMLSVIPPAKGAGVAGKAGIKGAKAAETAADVSKLVSQTKHVLRYDKISLPCKQYTPSHKGANYPSDSFVQKAMGRSYRQRSICPASARLCVNRSSTLGMG